MEQWPETKVATLCSQKPVSSKQIKAQTTSYALFQFSVCFIAYRRTSLVQK